MQGKGGSAASQMPHHRGATQPARQILWQQVPPVGREPQSNAFQLDSPRLSAGSLAVESDAAEQQSVRAMTTTTTTLCPRFRQWTLPATGRGSSTYTDGQRQHPTSQCTLRTTTGPFVVAPRRQKTPHKRPVRLSEDDEGDGPPGQPPCLGLRADTLGWQAWRSREMRSVCSCGATEDRHGLLRRRQHHPFSGMRATAQRPTRECHRPAWRCA
jgi:hypothetical protein